MKRKGWWSVMNTEWNKDFAVQLDGPVVDWYLRGIEITAGSGCVEGRWRRNHRNVLLMTAHESGSRIPAHGADAQMMSKRHDNVAFCFSFALFTIALSEDCCEVAHWSQLNQNCCWGASERWHLEQVWKVWLLLTWVRWQGCEWVSGRESGLTGEWVGWWGAE